MPFDRFLIAPFQSGLRTDLKSWLIPDDAFELLQNAYVFRGRVRKRFGSYLMGSRAGTVIINPLNSRLRIALTGGAAVGITDGAGNATGTVPGAIFKVGQAFSIGNELFTVNVLGAPGVMLTTGAAATHTYNTTTGAYVFAGATALTQIYFYPALPVMGIQIFENGPAQNQPTYAEDTQFVYIFAGGAWARAGINSPLWHGTILNLFWGTTFRYTAASTSLTAFFLTNFFAVNPNGAISANDDPIYYLSSATNTWTAFTPTVLTAGNKVLTARIIINFKNRLILLNTIEVDAAGANNSNFVNRARFSQVGDPTAANAFLEITQTGALGGGVIDAPTAEAIISAAFVKDRLIVYFERSIRELAFTGNDIIPFEWRNIDMERGAEGTFSIISLSQEVFAIDNIGVHTCNGTNVNRLDNNIPDKVWTIKNQNSDVFRIAGVRDYWVETAYWAYQSDNDNVNDSFNNKVLVYNYKNKTWAENDDSITAFGYFEQGNSPTWGTLGDTTWESLLDAWNSGYVQSQALQVVAGNQEGFTFLIFPDASRNAPALQLTNATLAGTVLTLTIVDHNLEASNAPDNGDYFVIENAQGATNLNGMVLPVNVVVSANVIQAIVPDGFTLGGTYTGGGTVTRISNVKIKSKQWNPYDSIGQNVYLARIDFSVVRTANGEITADYYPSATELSMISAGSATGALTGTNVLETRPYPVALYPLEQVQDRLWHPVYFQSSGECIQLYIYFNDAQMRSTSIAWSNVQIEGLVLHTSRASARLQ